MIQRNFYKILIILITICSFLSAKEVFSIKENRPGSLIIEFSIDSVWTSNKYNKIFTEPNLDYL